MENKLAELRANVRRGSFKIPDITWLINKVDELHAENRNLRHSKGLRPYLRLAAQNLDLAQQVAQLEKELDKANSRQLVNV